MDVGYRPSDATAEHGSRKTLMLLLVTTGHPDMHRYRHPNLGRLVQPRHYSSIEATAAEGMPWAADNDAFGDFKAGPFLQMLDRLAGLPGCLFVVAPDVVGNAARTAELFEEWEPVIRAHGLPVALAAQDGQQEPPWDRVDALFMGGSNAFKLGPDGEHWAGEARSRGKWLHFGRVNTERRIRYAATLHADSVDGSQWSRWKAIYLRGGLTAVAAERQARLKEVSLRCLPPQMAASSALARSGSPTPFAMTAASSKPAFTAGTSR